MNEQQNRELFGASCEPHGHDWKLTVWLEGPVDARTGMLTDLEYVDRVLCEEVVLRFHEQHFNAVDPDYFRDHQPTNEVLVQYFARKLEARFPHLRLARVRVAEAPDLFAEWVA